MKWVYRDSKEDHKRFEEKFGAELSSRFYHDKDALSKKGFNADITWLAKHVNRFELASMLDLVEHKGHNYRKIYEDATWRVVQPLDWETSYNLGAGTNWCISGTYNVDEQKPSQARFYFNEQYKHIYKAFVFITNKQTGKMWCYCPKIDGGYDLYSSDDEMLSEGNDDYIEGFPEVKGLEGISDKTMHSGFVVNSENELVLCKRKDQVIEIPDGVEKIKFGAFPYRASIGEIDIPASVKEIEKDAFSKIGYIVKLKFEDISSCRLDLPIGKKWMELIDFEGNRIGDAENGIHE